MFVRFNPPPGWPLPPDWTPPPSWDPDPSWPPAPPGWQFWIEVPPPVDALRRGTSDVGRGGITAGAVIAIGLLVVGLVVGIGRLTGSGQQDPTADPTTPAEPETWTVTNPDTGLVSGEVGACTTTDVMESSDVSTLPLMDCGHEHDAQVVGLFDLEGDDFPGSSTVRSDARTGCEDAFEGFVGVAIGDSDLDLWQITPTEGTWNNAGDREVICIAYLESGTTTGSWEGAAR